MTGFWPQDRPEIDVCLQCGLEGWGCICDPSRPHRKPSESEIEQARRTRLTSAELESELRGGSL